ncbi:MAG: endonuclease/exonuclease/phosphatase family protein [Actinomycetota bacterium]
MFRVLTANLYNGGASASALDHLLEELRPDVVAAQELAPDAGEVLGARFPHGMVAPALDHTGMALAGSVPLEVRRQPLPHRDALVAEGPVTIWCVHLANPVDAPPPILRRPRQVAALEALLAGSREPTLLVGDLNSTPLWPAYRRLRRHLDDGVAEWAERTGRPARATWGYRPWLPAMLRIDHALVRHLKVHEAFTVRVPGADHRALVVDVG